MSIKCKLYKLALRYIEKCNKEWNKTNEEYLKGVIKNLDKLTYKNTNKYYLRYSADAEWQKFSRYVVLDNAIQKLGEYEHKEEQIKLIKEN